MNSVIDESVVMESNMSEWYASSFGRFNYKHGKDTIESFEISG